MAHQSETNHSLKIRVVQIQREDDIPLQDGIISDVCILVLPLSLSAENSLPLRKLEEIIAGISKILGPEATIVTIGEVVDLVHVHAFLKGQANFHHWISIRRREAIHSTYNQFLPRSHFGALVHTIYGGPLRHSKTRVGYSYCPICGKTTKDYGGKKNTYHHYGTLISDVWRDITCDLHGDLTLIIERFADLFGVNPYKEVQVLDLRPIPLEQEDDNVKKTKEIALPVTLCEPKLTDTLMHGDCIQSLKQIPDNSVDFVFVDPPYNLGKKYDNYSDDLKITEYFQWCDNWLGELYRILRPGRTLAILNIPLYTIRHFLYLETMLEFQNWIAWDALSFPVRKVMPANYVILCFSKGDARTLPGLLNQHGDFCSIEPSNTFQALSPLAEAYCRRKKCVLDRKERKLNDRGMLTDLWWDIHRLRHNSRRVNHPTQLPPQLLYRMISIFTSPGEIVLDCFNGAGTTTLSAKQLGRKYIGIEISENYYQIALKRHEEILENLDPFRKENRNLTVKNNATQRLGKIKYEVPKNELQLEVKRIAEKLERLPTREELAEYSRYPIRYFSDYFASWGEVYAAARTTGMAEMYPGYNQEKNSDIVQLTHLDDQLKPKQE